MLVVVVLAAVVLGDAVRTLLLRAGAGRAAGPWTAAVLAVLAVPTRNVAVVLAVQGLALVLAGQRAATGGMLGPVVTASTWALVAPPLVRLVL